MGEENEGVPDGGVGIECEWRHGWKLETSVQGTPSSLVLLEKKGQYEVEPAVWDQIGEGDSTRPWRIKGLWSHPLGNGEPLKGWEGHAQRGNFEISPWQLSRWWIWPGLGVGPGQGIRVERPVRRLVCQLSDMVLVWARRAEWVWWVSVCFRWTGEWSGEDLLIDWM